jgi:DNA-directed RNA polymerase subunit RPC12/RpoP
MHHEPAKCSRCGSAMKLVRIEPASAWRSYERRVFECPECGQSESYTGPLPGVGALRAAVRTGKEHP